MAKVIILGGDNPELISEEIRKRAIEGEVVIINGEQEQKLREQINNGEIDEDSLVLLPPPPSYLAFNQEPYIIERLPEYEDFRYSHLTKKQREAEISPIRDSSVNPKISRNSPCPCGSGKKYKHCCCK